MKRTGREQKDVDKQDRLHLAHFLFPGETDGVDVTRLLKTAAASYRICRLKYSEGEYVQDICLHVHKDWTTMVNLKEPDAPIYELKESDEVKRACFFLFNCFEITDPESIDEPALHFSKSKFEELKALISRSSECYLAECLYTESGDWEGSRQLAKVLKGLSAEGDLLLCSRSENGWSFQHVIFIEEGSTGWMLRMSSEPTVDWVIAVPASRAHLCTSLYEWLLQAAPIVNPE